MSIKIEKLLDKNSPYFKTICDWQFAHLRKNYKKEKLIEFMERCLGDEKIPQTYIAIMEGEVVGMYQLDMYDEVDVRPDYYPWVANVYVDEKQRGKGICKFMMDDAVNKFRELGLKRVYLYTDHVNLYEKSGWKFLEAVELLEGEVKRIYVLEVE